MADCDERKPWEQQPGEPDKWYARFLRFRDQGSGRTKATAFRADQAETGGNRRAKKLPGSWDVMSKRWEWDARALAWDKHLSDERQAVWAARLEEQRAAEWEQSRKLLKMAETMLQMPLLRTESSKVSEDGKTIVTTVIMPAGWDIRDLQGCLALASKLARLSVGAETDRQAVDTQQTVIYRLPDNGRGDALA